MKFKVWVWRTSAKTRGIFRKSNNNLLFWWNSLSLSPLPYYTYTASRASLIQSEINCRTVDASYYSYQYWNWLENISVFVKHLCDHLLSEHIFNAEKLQTAENNKFTWKEYLKHLHSWESWKKKLSDNKIFSVNN